MARGHVTEERSLERRSNGWRNHGNMVWLGPYPSNCEYYHFKDLLTRTDRELPLQAITYALIDLYSHEEYIGPLRHEVQGQALGQLDGLPLLDAFLKESARVSAFESSECLSRVRTPSGDLRVLTVCYSWCSPRSADSIHLL